MQNYDNADLGIVALLLIGVAAFVTGNTDTAIITAVVAAIAGIARTNDKG